MAFIKMHDFLFAYRLKRGLITKFYHVLFAPHRGRIYFIIPEILLFIELKAGFTNPARIAINGAIAENSLGKNAPQGGFAYTRGARKKIR
jgi:hypothetical protein